MVGAELCRAAVRGRFLGAAASIAAMICGCAVLASTPAAAAAAGVTVAQVCCAKVCVRVRMRCSASRGAGSCAYARVQAIIAGSAALLAAVGAAAASDSGREVWASCCGRLRPSYERVPAAAVAAAAAMGELEMPVTEAAASPRQTEADARAIAEARAAVDAARAQWEELGTTASTGTSSYGVLPRVQMLRSWVYVLLCIRVVCFMCRMCSCV